MTQNIDLANQQYTKYTSMMLCKQTLNVLWGFICQSSQEEKKKQNLCVGGKNTTDLIIEIKFSDSF